jgi:hypothetical protein
MKKIWGSMLLMALLTAAAFTNIASAEDGSDRKDNHDQWKMEHTQLREDIMQNRMEIRDWRGNFHDEFGHLKDYLRTDLTDTEKGEVRDIIEAHKQGIKDETKTFIEVFTSANSSDDEIEIFVDDLVDLKSQMYDDLAPYIDPDMEEEFNDYVDALLVQFKENYTKRLQNFLDHKELEDDDTSEIQGEHSLPEHFRGRISQILGQRDDNKKGDFLQNVLDKIFNKMEQIANSPAIPDDTKQTLLDFLSEVDGLVQNELNNLVTDSDDSAEDDTADDLSEEDDSGDDEEDDANDDNGDDGDEDESGDDNWGDDEGEDD